MSDTNPLLQDPFFSEPILRQAPQGGGRPLTDLISESQVDLPPSPTGRGMAADVGRSLVSGGAKGLAGTLIGAPGSIETFFAKDVPEALRSGAAYLGEKADVLSPQQAREMTERPFYSGMSPEQQKGQLSPITGIPTYKGVTEQFAPTMKAAGAGVLAYEPQTAAGKTASAAAEFGAQGVPGAVRTMAGRVMTGAGAGAGSEFAALSAQDPDSVGYNKLLGALGGAGAGAAASSIAGRLFNGVKALAFSTKTAQDDLVNMLAEDIRRGLSPMTMEQFADAQRRGVPVTALDLASPATRKKIGMAADKNPGAEDAATKYNEFLQERAAASGQRVSGSLADMFGAPIDAPGLQAATAQAGQKTRDAVYTLMKADPSAQAIPMAVIGADLVRRPIMQQAMKEAAITAQNNPSWGIVVPSRVPGSPAVEAKFIQTPQGLREVPGTAAVPEQVTHGNLAYWDQVKRELDSKLKTASSPLNPNASDIATLKANKSDLVKKLDNSVKEYKNARDIASETFGAESAPMAGYEFFKNMNAFKRADLKNAFNRYTPEQKELFGVGFAHRIDEIANQPGGLASLSKKFSSDRDFKQRAMTVLGKDRYDQIQGTILSENLMSKAKELQFIGQSTGIQGATLAGAAIGAAADAAMAGSLMLSPNMATQIALGAAVGAGGKAFLNAMERKIAAKIVPMATDPAQAAELGRLASGSPAVSQVLDKIVNAMNNKIITGTSATVTSQQRPERASGGRTGGMTADMLIAAAERAKKTIGKDTEALLSTPDASVARALALANHKLEG